MDKWYSCPAKKGNGIAINEILVPTSDFDVEWADSGGNRALPLWPSVHLDYALITCMNIDTNN